MRLTPLTRHLHLASLFVLDSVEDTVEGAPVALFRWYQSPGVHIERYGVFSFLHPGDFAGSSLGGSFVLFSFP